jgi:hypothetical protein
MGWNDWQAEWHEMNLPDEAFAKGRRILEIDDAWLEKADPALKKEAMKAWFLARYCDPAEETPYMSSAGGYIWVHGGPYHPDGELQERFSGRVEDSLIDEIVNELQQNMGDDWAPIHWDDDYYDVFGVDVEDAKQPRDFLDTRLNQVSELLTVEGAPTAVALLEKLAFSNVITALESYLWETMSYAVEHDPQALEGIVTKYKTFSEKQILLGDIYKTLNGLKDAVKGHLQNVVWHRFDIVAQLMIHGLRIKPPSFKPFIDPVIKRHDIVHRSGHTKSGEPIELTSAEIADLAVRVRAFADALEQAITQRNADEAQAGSNANKPPVAPDNDEFLLIRRRHCLKLADDANCAN